MKTASTHAEELLSQLREHPMDMLPQAQKAHPKPIFDHDLDGLMDRNIKLPESDPESEFVYSKISFHDLTEVVTSAQIGRAHV